MKFLLAVLIVLISATANAQTLTNITIGSYIVSSYVDISTTQYGLGKGIVHEANPIQRYFTDRGPVVSGIAKGSMHVGIGYFLIKNRDRKYTLAAAILLTGLQVWVDYSNIKTIRRAEARR